jgi:rhodanese-related sulfurtransferase
MVKLICFIVMWRYSYVIRKEIKPNFLIMNTNQETIQPAELKSLLPSGCCLIDVREPVEHAEERIVGAKLIPLGQLEQRSDEIDRKAPVVVMCRSGKRGAEAMKKLHALGITNVRNLEGGILAWKGDGLPVGKSRGNSMPLMQQVQLTIGFGVLTGAILALTVHPNWVFLCAFFGAGLTMAGSTGWCGLAILMSKMPWNRVAGQSCCASGNCSL